ncbi:ANTAR domain-containing protein [Klenkia taihuensis]|uniref:ANTAR domain-containing protein n=1 Tax=Klenkia taihuensis TaxID=1225127 RepID=A0A1I1R7U4_9ACTN|nr:ANTAR domain-containing protein [Klenkia taihuensis]GHE07164.1 hypothetical protein GCM10011381_02160 [Klenkia taihuensis]SFD30312.1 ANTAR domain-containing protein [Klenkia taihuensis]
MDEHGPSGVRDRFCDALAAGAHAADASPRLADRLCAACVGVLPFAGAGLSFGFRVDGRLPLGASDAVAATAERLQFTTGTGPCSTAQRTRSEVVVSEQEIGDRWPGYAARLREHTTYRSAVAVPVGGPLAGAVVLDLYSTRPDRPAAGLLEDVRTVAAVVGEELATVLGAGDRPALGLPDALQTAAVAARQQVWVAVGALAQRQGTDAAGALALLRGLAFAHDLDLETAADRVVRDELG